MNDKSFLAKKAKRRPEIIAMVGPSGCGKTTGIAKLAAIRKFQDGEDVAIITTDVHRIGGSEQMEIFSRIFNVPFAVATDPDDMRACLAKWTRMDTIFIDCIGIGRQENEKFSELKAIINAVPYIDIHLVIPATMREVEMKAVANIFSTLPFHNVIFSKLDECVTPGAVLNFMKDTGYQVSYLSVGSEVPEDMAKAIGTVITEYLMQGFIPDGKPSAADIISGANNSADFYIANKNSDLIHRPDCVWSKRIKKENMIIFSSVSQALRHHYKPCGQCLPSDS
jgi:flagellar biosynthesis protein FlhF